MRPWPLGAGLAGVTLGYWTAFRPRSQVFGPLPYQGQVEEPVIALSFDDGPNEPYTSRLLSVLDDRKVRATFFSVGRCADRFPSTVRAVVQAGHVLGNHSYSHRFSSYLTAPDQRAEIQRCQE